MKTYWIGTAVLSLLVASSVMAHTGATGIVKERMDAMTDMTDKSKIASDMFKGKLEFDIAAVTEAADAFIYHGSRMQALFPDSEESRQGESTRALPSIWEDLQEFQTLIVEFETNSQLLRTLTDETSDSSTLKKAFLLTAKNCSGCHKRFRKPKS